MILVTGATGLIGSHLLYRLVAGGNTVRITVRDSARISGIRHVFRYYTSNVDDLISRVIVTPVDLLDYDRLEQALDGVSCVYHCAGIVSFNPSDRNRLIEHNVGITANLVNACLSKGVKRLLHVSSTSATGSGEQGLFVKEEEEWRYSSRRSGYSISKFESEREAWRAGAEGMEVVIVNPAMVIGPGNWGESSTSLIERCYRGLKFYTEGINAYVDVRDVARVMIRLMESDISGERYILASENISFGEFFGIVTRALGLPAPQYRARRWMAEIVWRLEWLRSRISGKAPLITRETARTAVSTVSYSSEKIKKELGFEFRPLKETIEWVCRHYLEDIKFTDRVV